MAARAPAPSAPRSCCARVRLSLAARGPASMSTRTLVVLAAILFALTVLVRAPERWLLAAVPKSIDCQKATGSVWSGTGRRRQAPGVSLTDVSWTLHPLSRALGRLDVELRSADARAP